MLKRIVSIYIENGFFFRVMKMDGNGDKNVVRYRFIHTFIFSFFSEVKGRLAFIRSSLSQRVAFELICVCMQSLKYVYIEFWEFCHYFR